MIQSWDTATKTTVRSDWSVGITARYHEGRWYILDVFRARVEFNELVDQIRSSCQRYGVNTLLIEDAASGQSIIQHLVERPCDGVPHPIGITPTLNKVLRFEAEASKIRAGQVVLPRTSPWVAAFVNEIVKFTGGKNDDQADALAQLLANPPRLLPAPINVAPIIVEEGEVFEELEYEGDPWAGR